MIEAARSELAAAVRRFTDAAILCVGDVMLDHYVYGEVERISPEAPIPVLHVHREQRWLGGAGNVVRNLAALGARTCFLGVVGDDAAGREVECLAGEPGIEPHILVERGRVTPVKTRYVAGTQQLLRADRETAGPLSPPLREDLLRLFEQTLPEHQVVVISDYAKGLLAGGTAGAVVAAARAAGRKVIVDPKGSDWSRYAGADVVKPNRRELALASGRPVDSDPEVIEAARALMKVHGFGAILVSLTQEGMVLVEPGAVHRLAAEAREVFDVSGAGDTAVATLAAALAVGCALPDAARLANAAAGIVVGRIGTAVVHREELAEAAIRQRGDVAKVASLAAAADRVATWRGQGLRIGFTNGCFDLLHPGHVGLLAQARAACDRLVVGLNSDASVKRLKGDSRPVQNQAARAEVLASLASVDLVVVFDEDTPLELIRQVRPAVLVKGSDYAKKDVVGHDVVEAGGGEVILVDLVPGHSTSSMVARSGGSAKTGT